MIRIIFLSLNALMFIAFGIAFIIDPVATTPLFLGVPAPAGDLIIDMRATYGGLSLGIGAFMAYSVINRAYLYQGILLAFLVSASLFIGRATGMMGIDEYGPAMLQSLILELVLTLLFGVLFFTGKRNS